MENHIETNFREIQKILDSCIAHDYKTKVAALFLKREYLTQAQLKDYLRQEIFRVTENIVAIQQKYRVVRNIVLDMDIPDFLWESGYWKGFVFQSGFHGFLSGFCFSLHAYGFIGRSRRTAPAPDISG